MTDAPGTKSDLGLSATALGLVLSLGAVGAFLGSVLASRLGRNLRGRPCVRGRGRRRMRSAVTAPARDFDAHPDRGRGHSFRRQRDGAGAREVYAVTLRQAVTPEQLLGT